LPTDGHDKRSKLPKWILQFLGVAQLRNLWIRMLEASAFNLGGGAADDSFGK
jgi:hypothetical protein